MLDLGAPFMFIHQFNFNDFILSRSQMKSPLIVVVVPIIPQKVKKQVAVNVGDHVNHACSQRVLKVYFSLYS
ncbi:hypothetical protein RIR_jg22677.t1 [Rhizophagus irregularis DAOM 181602=DAOM 197198]|uniref:Uncharacterized protein n=1 Tax=Rhizophagus irregularis (strain DAOM 197198w) TaxID=1432141 RepID=A0A015JYD5_RHIIW|nr:hypothetical protein RirG_183080 [Rhizophagus irregularis DAOM 197198w]GBC33932.1 hypothetical protein RIR_jg22677.t1 [Rhizophagus irregularis DAOM 181602=DAOM 197198]